MKETLEDKRLVEKFKPGVLSKDGFLGADKRHIHDIIEADARTLAQFGVTREEIADALADLIEAGKKGLGQAVDHGPFEITVFWERGLIPDPFGGRVRSPKLVATVTKKETGETFRFTQLSVHMIREHGFFEGKGSTFRLEPDDIIRFLDLRHS